LDILANRTARTRWRRLAEQMNTLGLSVLLGLIVWLIAINQENPFVQAQFSERLPVTVRGLPDTLQPIQDLSKETVQVRIQAPRRSWDNLDASDFSAYIDLAGLDAGVHDVEVEVDVVDPSVRIVDVQRPVLRVQLDDVVVKTVPVRVDILDSTAFGYDWQPPIVDPITATVEGPRTQVDQVTMVKAEVYLRNAKTQVERTQPVAPQNSQAQAVPRVQVEPGVVRVIVPVEQWPGRKEVAVRVNLVGQPSAGYRLSAVRVNPSTVVLLGDAGTLSSVPGFVETEPVPLAGATGEISRRLTLLVPDNVTVLEGNTVDITASITPIEGGTTVRQPPIIQGLGAGLEATVALETVDVILSGPLPLLESLGSDDIFVILDLTGLLPGTHVVQPRVVVPTGIQVTGVLPASVEVTIDVFQGTEPISPTLDLTGTVEPSRTAPLTDTEAPPNGASLPTSPPADGTLQGTVTASEPVTATTRPQSTPTPAAAPTATSED
jgi:YbbR domain-containing protein